MSKNGKHFLRGKRDKKHMHGFRKGEKVRVVTGNSFEGWCGEVDCFKDGFIWVHLNETPPGVEPVDGKLFLGLEPHKLVRI